jgi:hypothetical protein
MKNRTLFAQTAPQALALEAPHFVRWPVFNNITEHFQVRRNRWRYVLVRNTNAIGRRNAI